MFIIIKEKIIKSGFRLFNFFMITIITIVPCISCTGSTVTILGQSVNARIGRINASGEEEGVIGENYEKNPGYRDNTELKDIITGEVNPENEVVMESNGEGTIEGNAVEEQQTGNIEIEEDRSSGEIIEGNDEAVYTEVDNIDFSNSADFRIEVDLSRQKVLIYYKDKLLKEWICSGGTEEKPTPEGEFKTTGKGEYFWNPKYNMGGYYWIRFYGAYLFHSVPFDKNNNIIQEEYNKLGVPASHGCIRLEVENARWLYEKLPLGVRVNIY